MLQLCVFGICPFTDSQLLRRPHLGDQGQSLVSVLHDAVCLAATSVRGLRGLVAELGWNCMRIVYKDTVRTAQ